MKQKELTITSNEKIAEDIYRMVLGTEEPEIERPGQFINIKLDGFYLRRPISVADWDNESVTIIYKTVGRGTEAMTELETGSRIDVLLPLGNGFDIDKCGDKPVLIGGGVGLPPMYGTAKALIEAGISPQVIAGFNDKSQAFYIEEFENLGAQVHVTTADGSKGTEGFVTDKLKDLEYTHVLACGPEPMLKAIDMIMDKNAGGQFSFEERMGCGFGACMGCSCRTKYGSKRICKDGPVLERSEIIW